MSSENHEAEINWGQLSDLINDESDESQREMLAEIWPDMCRDLQTEWTLLESITEDAELKLALHRLRGVVSMWGLGELTNQMLLIEKEPETMLAWQQRGAELADLRDRSLTAITTRYPWLNGSVD